MNSGIKLAKSKLKYLLNDKKIIDIILFGSVVKGKENPKDIDIAVISREKIKIEDIKGFHISLLTLEDFFINPPTLINTLFREGYSLKNKKFFSEIYSFSNKVLFKYDLTDFPSSLKVKIVNILRGKRQDKGLVLENNGEWIANQVFVCPISEDYIFEEFFKNFKIKYKKSFVLIH